MTEWLKNVQNLVFKIDECIKKNNDEELTLKHLAEALGYSEYYVSRKFSEISGMPLRDYMRYRRLAFALKEVRDTEVGILDIALRIFVQRGFYKSVLRGIRRYAERIPQKSLARCSSHHNQTL